MKARKFLFLSERMNIEGYEFQIWRETAHSNERCSSRDDEHHLIITRPDGVRGMKTFASPVMAASYMERMAENIREIGVTPVLDTDIERYRFAETYLIHIGMEVMQ